MPKRKMCVVCGKALHGQCKRNFHIGACATLLRERNVKKGRELLAQGLSHKETAALLGMNRSTFYALRHRYMRETVAKEKRLFVKTSGFFALSPEERRRQMFLITDTPEPERLSGHLAELADGWMPDWVKIPN